MYCRYIDAYDYDTLYKIGVYDFCEGFCDYCLVYTSLQHNNFDDYYTIFEKDGKRFFKPHYQNHV